MNLFADAGLPQGVETGSIGVILAQPDQSKHLETATFKVHDQFVDMCNLRTET
jgi:tRNA nucleotidyltransferase (CCA-adding enzyme)